MQVDNNYQEMLATLRKLVQGAKRASSAKKYAALDKIIDSVDKISTRILTEKDRNEAYEILEVIYDERVAQEQRLNSPKINFRKVQGEIIA